MIDFSRIKLPKFVFKLEQKGLLKALGLHHASVMAAWVASCHFMGIGYVGALTGIGWYGCREYGNGPYPPKEFEILDFVSPLIVGLGYLAL